MDSPVHISVTRYKCFSHSNTPWNWQTLRLPDMLWYVATSRRIRTAKPFSMVPSLFLHFSRSLTARLQAKVLSALPDVAPASKKDGVIGTLTFPLFANVHSHKLQPKRPSQFLHQVCSAFQSLVGICMWQAFFKDEWGKCKESQGAYPKSVTGPMGFIASRKPSAVSMLS